MHVCVCVNVLRTLEGGKIRSKIEEEDGSRLRN